MKPRKPIARSTKPIKRSPVKRGLGKVGKRKYLACKKALDDYFGNPYQLNQYMLSETKHNPNAPRCQICGRMIWRHEADPAHKIRRSQGGKDTPENLVAAHRLCHGFIDSKIHRYKILATDEANLLNGKVVKWTPMIQHELQIFLSTGFDYAGNAVQNMKMKQLPNAKP